MAWGWRIPQQAEAPVEYRTLGRTGIRVPAVGFGCGNVGGLMIRGTHDVQVHAVQHALSLGIDYFDTAAAYGDGQSETHLGEVLAELRPDVHVATKFRIDQESSADIAGAVRRSLEASLRRLQRDYVDVLQLHNNLRAERGSQRTVSAHDVLRSGGIADALDELRSDGLIRHLGFTGMGETDEVHAVIASGRFDTVQAYYNLLNPSAGGPVRAGFPAQDFRELMAAAAARDIGVIVIRSLAGGALGGPGARRGLASNNPGAMVPGNDYEADVSRAGALAFLTADGWSLAQASVRFALDHPSTSTVVVGFSDEAQIDAAAAAADAEPLADDVRSKLRELWATDLGLAGST